ncbi:MAG: hypothetical protein PHH71_02530 [Clostridia bacterium]|jgi:uncharacterized membrane protein|nr:hypothetical protein [Clostridia bacterium]MDD3232034.1 hypothetical protein [Clostridia bacterium]MDD3862289.1 hypothetical protein [Clostridia bacterium]MDD4408517.1 hypothetical protein [Clostridia bacterium]
MSNIFSDLFKKLKSIKHIEIILAILFGLIILLVYFSSAFSNSDTNENKNKNNENASTVSEYVIEVEDKLSTILSKINGAGKVSVMIMVEKETQLETTILPNIASVIIVAEGAGNVWVKLEIIKAVEALLDLSSSNIEVLIGS